MTEISEGASVRVKTGLRGRPPLGTILKAYKNGTVKVELTNGARVGEVLTVASEAVTAA